MKRVFLRADLNVPLKDKKIMQDFRLQAILPAIDSIQKAGNKVILATHIGRPPALEQPNFFDENLSTQLLVPWFEDNGYAIEYEIDLLQAIAKSKHNPEKILLLENLRFFNGEQAVSDEFARLLSQCADLYVNDAFGVLHRNNTSITLLPTAFATTDRRFGPLVHKELDVLTKLKQNPEQPFVLVLGGKKVETKLGLLEQFLDRPKTQRPTSILIGGAIARKIPDTFLQQAESRGVTVLLPVDGSDTDIGPHTIELFSKEISRAKTIFANGTMGVYENEASAAGSKAILKAIAQTKAYSVIGGGDAVAATFQFELADKMNFLSTGGGATLAFLASRDEHELPGIAAMEL